MKRAFPWLVAALVTASQGQMMAGGGPMATSNYFPMVEGARYEYMHSGGPWASSVTVIHLGQAWAGREGLAGLHTTYTCMPGMACAPDATDFYGMDMDGVHYYGGMGSDDSGMRFSTITLTNPEWPLKNPVSPGAMMSGSPGYANAESWSTYAGGMDSLAGQRGYLNTCTAAALETVSTPAGTFTQALHVREQRGGSTRDAWYAPGVGLVMASDGVRSMKLASYSLPGGSMQGAAAAMPFMPYNGLWWNPAEPGTGYNLQVQHGVMVATIFSFTPAGDPTWYYAVGTLARDADGRVMMGSSLDRYQGGQCASCAFRRATVAGSDGAFAIAFDSPTSGTLTLPAGRSIRIQPYVW